MPRGVRRTNLTVDAGSDALHVNATPKPPVPLTPEGLREAFKDFPAIDLLERRFTNPQDPGSLPILLKDEAEHPCLNSEHQNLVKPNQTHCKVCKLAVRKWFVYWGNTAKQGRYSQLMAKAYVPVEVKELRDEMDVADLIKQKDDNARVLVRRGDRGQEILMKQPLAAWNIIKARARAQKAAQQANPKKRREARAEAVAQEFGSEAADRVYAGEIREESFTRHRTTLGEEAEGLE